MAIRMMRDDEVDEPSSTWFHTILIALTLGVCYNVTIMAYRYYYVVRQEKIDRLKKSKENVTEVWYLEADMKKDAEKKKKMIKR